MDGQAAATMKRGDVTATGAIAARTQRLGGT